jgi:hypothetical protein
VDVILTIVSHGAWLVAIACVWETEYRARDARIWGDARPVRDRYPIRLRR